ncbi:g8717 [Coccomyxa viridis]|uniref:G8717 protein n=1 Tax=Coccomyxa viridis TaxID=1274662 RepID=A0ABP1G5W5_9CHLO
MELEEDLDKQRLQINREIAALDRENEKWEKHLQTSTNPIAKEYLEIFIKSNKELRELKCTSIAKLEVIKSANEGVMNINIIDDDVWRDILSFAEVEAKTNKDIPPSKSKAVPCFGWDDRDVHAQSDRYIPHINNIIHLPAANKDFEWVDAATKEPHLLSYDSSQTLGYEFRGTAAVLLTEKQTRMCFKPMLCAHLLLEVNKELTDRNVIQAQAKLLLANMHDPERRPVLVLTDLCEIGARWNPGWM